MNNSQRVSSFKARHSTKRQSLLKDGCSGDCFFAVLLDKTPGGGRQLFREFLRRSLSEENLLFLDAVDAFKASFDQDESRQNCFWAAQRIVLRFLKKDAKHEVNIPSRMMENVANKLDNGKISYTLFNEIENVVIANLKNDDFHRFLQTESFKQWESSGSGFSDLARVVLDQPTPSVSVESKSTKSKRKSTGVSLLRRSISATRFPSTLSSAKSPSNRVSRREKLISTLSKENLDSYYLENRNSPVVLTPHVRSHSHPTVSGIH